MSVNLLALQFALVHLVFSNLHHKLSEQFGYLCQKSHYFT